MYGEMACNKIHSGLNKINNKVQLKNYTFWQEAEMGWKILKWTSEK
jgi:hypothetical protein